MRNTLKFHIRVYYEDTDVGGIVYYANYLKFAERARTEALRSLGINQSDLMRKENIYFIVRHCNIDFLRPAKLDDLLTIETLIHDINRVSINMIQDIKKDGEILVSLKVKLAIINSSMKPVKLPDYIKKSMLEISN